MAYFLKAVVVVVIPSPLVLGYMLWKQYVAD